ncbi:fibrinogen-like protein A isoform X1 [Styela clava]
MSHMYGNVEPPEETNENVYEEYINPTASPGASRQDDAGEKNSESKNRKISWYNIAISTAVVLSIGLAACGMIFTVQNNNRIQKLMEALEVEIENITTKVMRSHEELEVKIENLTTKLMHNPEELEMKMVTMNNRIRKIDTDTTLIRINYKESELKIENLTIKVMSNQEYLSQALSADCSEYRENLSRLGRRVTAGKETIYITLDGEIASVNCDFNESNEWTVIQRRMDGSVDFYRGWEEYKKGFGNPDGELWLGLDKLHRMTSRKNYSLRIDLLNWEGERRYAAYSTFRIGDKDSNYRLTVSGYSGNAKDGMNRHNNLPFTTHDRDNDQSRSNCAVRYHGAWWYGSCYAANLNGKYYKSSSGPTGNGVSWQHWDGDDYSLKFVEMKIKPN